jgi:hypothetical protein
MVLTEDIVNKHFISKTIYRRKSIIEEIVD